jgi:hypothetical protein
MTAMKPQNICGQCISIDTNFSINILNGKLLAKEVLKLTADNKDFIEKIKLCLKSEKGRFHKIIFLTFLSLMNYEK